MSEIELRWSGPFSLVSVKDLSLIYDIPDAATAGIYLWAIPFEGRYLINYVGVACQSVADRQAEHMRYYLTGEYAIYDPNDFEHARKTKIYHPGEGFATFLAKHRELCEAFFKQIGQVHLFFAPVGGNRMMLERVESSIIEAIRHAGGVAVQFLDNMRISRWVPQEQRMQAIVHDHQRFEGLPGELRI